MKDWIKEFFKKPKVEIKEKTTLVVKSRYLKDKLPTIEEFRLKERRQKLKLSQKEVSDKTKIVRTTILNLENRVYKSCEYNNLSTLHNFYLQEESKLK